MLHHKMRKVLFNLTELIYNLPKLYFYFDVEDVGSTMPKQTCDSLKGLQLTQIHNRYSIILPGCSNCCLSCKLSVNNNANKKIEQCG